MGYTTVANREGAVNAASALFEMYLPDDERRADDDDLSIVARFPHAIDHVAAEAGIIAPLVCARAFVQAQGDVARAVSLVRAWSAMLPRLGHVQTRRDDWHVLRRITPAYAEPRGGQYLGASRDFEQRLLIFAAVPSGEGAARTPSLAHVGAIGDETLPVELPPATDVLDREGLLARPEPIEPRDITRSVQSRLERGPFLQLLSRAETGGLTALAYAGIRGHGQRQDPTLVELRTGSIPIRTTRADTGGAFVLGHVTATLAEVALYALHEDGGADPGFTLGLGLAPGRAERRAIASAMLDACTTRAGVDPEVTRAPYDDREFIALAVDGQEAAGFVEHLKLPHHVTFAADLARVRASAGNADGDGA